jgi:hypothetical protein
MIPATITPPEQMTRPGLIAEVRRLREHLALYHEIEADRAADAAKRAPAALIIEQVAS